MKAYASFLVLATCLPIVLGLFSSDVDIDLHEKERDCAATSGATHESINEARQRRKIPDTPEMAGFAKCMLEKYNVINEDSTINSNVHSYSILHDTDGLYGVSERCIRLRGKDIKDTGRLILNCYLDGNQLVMALTPL